MLALALIATAVRTYVRLSKYRRSLADDGFFYAAALFLTAGTGVLYKNVDLLYFQSSIQAGLLVTPSDLVAKFAEDAKLQTAVGFLLCAAFFSIKFSFLFFFRHLIWQSNRLMTWWWIVVAILIPTSGVFICSDFIFCPYFDERILGGFFLTSCFESIRDVTDLSLQTNA